jgi:hypothetical protein
MSVRGLYALETNHQSHCWRALYQSFVPGSRALTRAFLVQAQWSGSPFDSLGKVYVDEKEDQQKCKHAPQDEPDSRQWSALDTAVVEGMWHGSAKAFFDKRKADVKAGLLSAGSSEAANNANPSDDLPMCFRKPLII